MDRYDKLEELQKTWSEPRELHRAVPREIALTAGGIAIVCLAGLLIVGGMGAMVGLERRVLSQAEFKRLIHEEGREAEARITRHWRSSSKDSQPMVAYEFDCEGRMCKGESSTPSRIWRGLAVGSPLAVRYLPSDPGRNHPRDWEPSMLPFWFPIIIGGVLAVLGAVLGYALHKEKFLLREGRPAPGIVTGYGHASHGKKSIHYEFRLMSGGLATGKSSPKRKLPAIGAAVCVVYDRDNPRRNSMYPMELVRVVV